MFDGQDGLRDDAEIAFKQKIVDAHDGASERIFDGGQECVGGAFVDSAKGGVEGRAGYRGDGLPEKLNGRGFAEGSGFTLEGHSQTFAFRWAHRQALSCNKQRKTKSGDSTASEKEFGVTR
jgi:hypothetical protein